MEQRKLGLQGLIVSALGLGCMGMSDFYGERNEADASGERYPAYMMAFLNR